MIITGDKLRLYYWDRNRSTSGPTNLSEIEKGEYGYNLEAGQRIFAIRYDMTNLECYFNVKVLEASKDGLLINIYDYKEFGRKDKFIPWIKEFPCPAYSKNIEKCTVYIEPCEYLYEKNSMRDILNGNIPDETYKNDRLIKDKGRGIWHQHGGWRTGSRYAENLKYFVKIGQLSLL